ncbi:Protein-L-isoaspartate O-methyltransferase 2 [Capsicum chinense]|uniref:Protein-L-isoaspartate O-methyltransferase n=1 Tax=Capsicum annuum TaxID=4072 RepID=A0A1U8FY35_CAPAN|nr:protein-L-isoaspartate O-methyltransferase 1 [Capsicum annuum]KAF3677439.1 Protein-L-isoaspartate(D-aspartate) O-methyltransferase [Capsicum annuum]PHT87315.1 Protein-L-isoaspartate(D-aspartate) O-methyltransferase [Capsicum annuum]PHU16517.1 Protein-L-isoaspartate O-methyltransferase 2 [Capsicum chinense]
MPSSISLQHSLSATIAYGFRYRTLLKQHTFLSYAAHQLQRQKSSTLPLFSSSFCRVPNLRFFTGNSLFSRMEQFWSGSSVNRNKGMIQQLQRYGVIKSHKVTEIMETVDRGLFVPDGTPAYVDSPMSIGYNATISAPHMHAMCLELLEDRLQPGMHALDVGSGTGYLTACFALMVGPQGRAVGVEHIPELVTWSIKNVEKSAAAPLLKEGSLSLHVGDGRKGWPEHAPYDAIHVGAAAADVPQDLIDQLKPGGRMVIPVGTFFQDLKVIDKKLDGSISVRSETSVRYVPLTSREAQIKGTD